MWQSLLSMESDVAYPDLGLRPHDCQSKSSPVANCVLAVPELVMWTRLFAVRLGRLNGGPARGLKLR